MKKKKLKTWKGLVRKKRDWHKSGIILRLQLHLLDKESFVFSCTMRDQVIRQKLIHKTLNSILWMIPNHAQLLSNLILIRLNDNFPSFNRRKSKADGLFRSTAAWHMITFISNPILFCCIVIELGKDKCLVKN